MQFVDLPSVLANFTGPSPAINLTMRVDARGHLSAANAALVSNSTEKAGGSGLFGLFGGKKDEAASKDAEAVTDEGKEGGESDAPAASVSAAAVKAERVAIRFREKALGGYHMSGEEKRLTQQR